MKRHILASTSIALILLVLVSGICLAQDGEPDSASEMTAAPLVVDTAEVIVSDFRADDFVLRNGFIFYVQNCVGDVGSEATNIKRQAIDDPASQTILFTLPECTYYRHLQVEPSAIYYVNASENRLEKRIFSNINTRIDLVDYGASNDMVALALWGDYLYLATDTGYIKRIDKYTGDSVNLIDGTTYAPLRDLVIDAYNVYWSTSNGVHFIDHFCGLPCSAGDVHHPVLASAGELFAASTSTATGDVSVFYTKPGVTPQEVYSWDCNVPGQTGCHGKHLGTAKPGTYSGYHDMWGIVANEDSVFWLEADNNSGHTHLRRNSRDGYEYAPDLAPVIEDPIAPNINWNPAILIHDDTYIYFRHEGISRIEQDAEAIVWDYQYDGMEVTQGLQSGFQEIDLIANRQTQVRVWGHQVTGPETLRPQLWLHGSRDDVPLPGSPLSVAEGDWWFRAGGDLDRFVYGTEWVFYLPPEWTEDDITLEAVIDPRRVYDPVPSSSGDRFFPLYQKAPTCMVALRVRAHGPYGSPRDGGWSQAVGTAYSMLPVPDIKLYSQWSALEEGIPLFYSAYELPDDSWKLLVNIQTRDVFSDDPDSCDDANARTLYVGLVDQKVNTGSTSGAAFRDKDQQWIRLPETNPWVGVVNGTFPITGREAVNAHETGHNYGFKHVDCPVGVPDDPDGSYPYNTCDIGVELGRLGNFIGRDFMKPRIPIGPFSASDLMSYNTPKWTSPYTWNKIASEIMYDTSASLMAQNVSAEGAMAHISGSVTPGFTTKGRLHNTWLIPVAGMSQGMVEKWSRMATETLSATAATPDQTNYHVQLIGSHGVVLDDQDIELVKMTADEFDNSKQFFELVLTAPSATVFEMKLLAGSTVLDTIDVRPAPSVDILEPAGGENIDESLTIRWRVGEADPDLSFLVQYSHDNSVHWQAIAADVQAGAGQTMYELTVDSSDLPGSGGQNGRVRIMASSGWNTTIVTSNPFSVPQRYPHIWFASPQNGQWIKPGEPVRLWGGATDAEDGLLEGAQLVWQMDGTEVGTGDRVMVEGLEPGNHTASLWATDTSSRLSVGLMSFAVAPLEVDRGTAVLDGHCNDDAYLGKPGVTLQPYADGSAAQVVFTRSDDYFWACFHGLQNEGPSSPGSYAGIRLDGDNSRDADAQANDYGFYVGQDGAQFTKAGDGAGGFNQDPSDHINYSLASRVREGVGGNTWNAELRLDLGFVPAGDQVGLAFGHYWVDAQGDDYMWPFSAVWNAPNTWAETNFDRTPYIEELDPGSVEVPLDSGSSVYFTVYADQIEDGDIVTWDGTEITSLYLTTAFGAWVDIADLTPGSHTIRIENGDNTDIKSNPVTAMVYHKTLTLTALSPDTTWEGNTVTVTISGTDFVDGATAYWESTALVTTFVNATTLEVTLTPDELVTAMTAGIVVENPYPSNSVSNRLDFDVVPCVCSDMTAVSVDIVNDNDVYLTWSSQPDQELWRIYRSYTNPYFSPRLTNQVGTVTSSRFTDEDALLREDDAYYVVRAESECGATSENLARVGVLRFQLEPGGKP